MTSDIQALCFMIITLIWPSISQANYDCNLDYDPTCVGVAMIVNQYAEGRGYKSMWGPSTTITKLSSGTNAIECQGSMSCLLTNNIQTWIKMQCLGGSSCANATIRISDTVELTKTIRCRAAESCKHSNLIASTAVQCYGDYSCAYSLVQDTPVVDLSGAYSGNYAYIDSRNVAGNVMNISLDGYYAGFGATIRCRSDDICYIKCRGTGCYMFLADCDASGGNNCIITKVAPNAHDLITLINDFSTVGYSMLYPQSLTLTNDNLCETEALSMTYDDNEEHLSGADISITSNNSGPICCRASRSCSLVSSNSISASSYNANKHRIICSGFSSCYGDGSGTIYNEYGPIFCSGKDACDLQHIEAPSDNIYCTGSSGCTTSVIIASNVYCSGNSACYKSNITSDNHDINIYFIGAASGWKATIFCNEGSNCYIECAARDSCLLTIAHCNGNCNIVCDEAQFGCPKVFSHAPTPSPTYNPLPAPTNQPTSSPTSNPTPAPTQQPSPSPTKNPTSNPTPAPTHNPTASPTINPMPAPTSDPTPSPTQQPTPFPTDNPTKYPTKDPSIETNLPSINPAESTTSLTTPSPLNSGMVTETTNDVSREISDEGPFDLNIPLEIQYVIIGCILIIALAVIIACTICCISRSKKKRNLDTNVIQMEKITSVTISKGETNDIAENTARNNKNNESNSLKVQKQQLKSAIPVKALSSDEDYNMNMENLDDLDEQIEEMYDANNNTTAGKMLNSNETAFDKEGHQLYIHEDEESDSNEAMYNKDATNEYITKGDV